MRSCAGLVAAGPDRKGHMMTSGDSGQAGRANRLIEEISPYLLQHAHNPVDWYPWGDEAFTRAQQENKPIFLSIGYSACHWCHVMERESFESASIAALLNENFVSIKVDREERPDIDEIYMMAVQILNGSGGWPMSVFLTPDLKPFYGGTYLPPTDMQGRPGFATVLKGVIDAWRDRRGDLLNSATKLTNAVKEHMAAADKSGGSATAELIAHAADDLKSSFDRTNGGFGGAPKFPPTGAVALLLRQYARTQEKLLLDMASFTLSKMAHGGMYDQLGGGFHRYSVDARWLVPHFEKMLYDNALLAQVYLEGYQATRNPLYRSIAARTLDYVLREMADPEGGFHSSEDADSEGQEGRFYLWTRREILDALGEEDGRLFCAFCGVKDEGNFQSHEPYHAGQNVLYVARSKESIANESNMKPEELGGKLRELRAKLMSVRSKRVRPGRDDKILTSWNALMISALAQGYQVIQDPRYREAAVRAGDFLLHNMAIDGELLRTYRNGESRISGFLDDYAFTVLAFIDLYETTFDLRWISLADVFARKMISLFWDDTGKRFFLASGSQTHLIARSHPSADGAEPSGNSASAVAYLRLARFVDDWSYEKWARLILDGNADAMMRSPQAFTRMLCAVDLLLYPPQEIVIVGKPQSADTQALLRALHARFVPNKMVMVADPAGDDFADVEDRIPLFKGKKMISGKATAYVCRNFACGSPATTPEDFVKELGFGPAASGS